MKAETFELVKNILFLLFFIAGTALMWGWIKLPAASQQKFEQLFARSRTRFKWLFLTGFILLSALNLWKIFAR